MDNPKNDVDKSSDVGYIHAAVTVHVALEWNGGHLTIASAGICVIIIVLANNLHYLSRTHTLPRTLNRVALEGVLQHESAARPVCGSRSSAMVGIVAARLLPSFFISCSSYTTDAHHSQDIEASEPCKCIGHAAVSSDAP